MANARSGYKRIMGEIPEDMHEKITLYNKISDRPLNVSRAIELCMQQAVKKIDDELIEIARENKSPDSFVSDELFTILKKEVHDGLFSAHEIHKLCSKFMKAEGWTNFDNYNLATLYPIDEVELDNEVEEGVSYERVVFYAKKVLCFSVTHHLKENRKASQRDDN